MDRQMDYKDNIIAYGENCGMLNLPLQEKEVIINNKTAKMMCRMAYNPEMQCFADVEKDVYEKQYIEGKAVF